MRHLLSRIAVATYCALLVTVHSGCMSTSSGTASLTSDKVNDIKKGVTTRSDIEKMFGPPAMVSMMPNGKHIMSYYFSQSDVHATGASYIPVVNLFASGSQGQIKNRTLQVNLDANDVVEDYQFNDSVNNVAATGNMFGGTSMTSTPATTQP